MKVYPCLECEHVADELHARPWGTPTGEAFAYLPFVCGECGALALIDMDTGELRPVDEEIRSILRGNRVLWDAIERAQAQCGRPNSPQAAPSMKLPS